VAVAPKSKSACPTPSLKNKRSKSLGVCFCAISNNFYAEVINGIEVIASKNGYHVIITQSQESYEKEMKNVEYLELRSVDGLLASVASETCNVEHFQKLQNKGTPVVLCDRVSEELDTHMLVADSKLGTYECIGHLISNGFKKIRHITSSPGLSITTERLEGYKQALYDKKQPIDERLIKHCMHGGMIREEIEKAVDELTR
jgi:LacI family transcriptional regulator